MDKIGQRVSSVKRKRIISVWICMLLVLNVVFIGVVEVQTSDEQSYPKAEKMAEYLQWDENGKCAMAKEGTDIVDLYQGFAMVIDNTGKIIWEYKLPEELEQTYTLQEVAVFAKWYLKDYPVDITMRWQDSWRLPISVRPR